MGGLEHAVLPTLHKMKEARTRLTLVLREVCGLTKTMGIVLYLLVKPNGAVPRTLVWRRKWTPNSQNSQPSQSSPVRAVCSRCLCSKASFFSCFVHATGELFSDVHVLSAHLQEAC